MSADDTVLDGEIISGQSMYVPFSDLYWITKDALNGKVS